MSNERRAPASWPTDDMVVRGAEELHDSLRMFGIDINFDTKTKGTEIQQEIVEAVFNAMLAAAPSAPATVQGDGWIPVSERLPNIVQEVIVNSEFDGITAGFLDSYGEWYSPNSDYKLARVVAWQPLPAPPAIAAAPKAEQPPVHEPVAEVLVSSGMVVDVVRTQTNLEDGFHRLYAAPQPVSDDVAKALKTAANRIERLALEVDGDWRGYATEWAEEALAAYRAAMGSKGDE